MAKFEIEGRLSSETRVRSIVLGCGKLIIFISSKNACKVDTAGPVSEDATLTCLAKANAVPVLRQDIIKSGAPCSWGEIMKESPTRGFEIRLKRALTGDTEYKGKHVLYSLCSSSFHHVMCLTTQPAGWQMFISLYQPILAIIYKQLAGACGSPRVVWRNQLWRNVT